MKKILITDKQAKEFARLIVNDIKPFIASHKENYYEFLKKHYPEEREKP